MPYLIDTLRQPPLPAVSDLEGLPPSRHGYLLLDVGSWLTG
jgi:hypothetical protein